MEKMNLDTYIVDIYIIENEISKYNKGFKNKEKVSGFTHEYSGIKEKIKYDIIQIFSYVKQI